MKNRFLIFQVLQVFAVLGFCHGAHSQDGLSKFQSINSASFSSGSSQRTFKSVSRGNVADDLRLETVDDVLESRSRRERFESLVRSSIYFKYLGDTVDLREEYNYVFDEEDMAEKLVVYETVRMLGQRLKDTPIFDMYKDVLESLKGIKDKTTVTLAQNSSGKYDFSSGADKENAFLKFKLHFSAQRGPEPRMHFSKNVVLRYDVFNQETLLEYRCGF